LYNGLMLTNLSKLPLRWLGLVQALGVTLYCALVGLLIWKGNEFFGAPIYLGPVMFLVLFIVSALICASIVFYHPCILFFEGKKRQAIDLVLITTGWLFLFFLIILFLSVLIRRV